MKAAIFDLDGTILYTLDCIARAGNRMLEELGYEARPVEEYRYYCGDGSLNLVRRALAAVGGLTPENAAAGDILNRRFLAEDPLYGVHPYPGMPEALAGLKSRGYRLAVVSNKPDDAARSTVTAMYGELFDLTCGQREGIPIKPDPKGALLAARALGAAPSSCLYFGDSGTDMRTGKAAGMYTVGVLWGYREEEELLAGGADCLIREPREISGIKGIA